MSRRCRRATAAAPIVAAALALTAGCTSTPARFHTLDAASTPATTATAADRPGAPVLAVGPVTVPELVDRPQLVLRGPGSRVTILESQRWAEPLADGVTRVIVRSLAEAMPDAVVMPASTVLAAAWRLQVDVTALDVDAGRATVELAWSAQSRERTGDTGGTISGHAIESEPVAAQDVDGFIEAQRRALQRAASRIARAIGASIRPPASRPAVTGSPGDGRPGRGPA